MVEHKYSENNQFSHLLYIHLYTLVRSHLGNDLHPVFQEVLFLIHNLMNVPDVIRHAFCKIPSYHVT